jgi:hypothetical protein
LGYYVRRYVIFYRFVCHSVSAFKPGRPIRNKKEAEAFRPRPLYNNRSYSFLHFLLRALCG